LISCGLGTFRRLTGCGTVPGRASVRAITVLQMSTHSSQMFSPSGPAMRVLTAERGRPQKEQKTSGALVLRAMGYAFAGVAPSTSSTSPYFAASSADMKKSRSVSREISLSDLPVCLASRPLR